MSLPNNNRSGMPSAQMESVRATAHRLLDNVLDQILEQDFFGAATLDLASQNGKLCKCEADVRRHLRTPNRLN